MPSMPSFRSRSPSPSCASDVSQSSCGESAASSLSPPRICAIGGIYNRSGEAGSQQLQHEGWMSKLSSHKLAGGAAARWQSRYWTLQGCKLRYHKRPGAPPLKAFDLCQMREVTIVQGSWRWGQPREMELSFG